MLVHAHSCVGEDSIGDFNFVMCRRYLTLLEDTRATMASVDRERLRRGCDTVHEALEVGEPQEFSNGDVAIQELERSAMENGNMSTKPQD